jgi:Nuclease A inhibitor-like protein
MSRYLMSTTAPAHALTEQLKKLTRGLSYQSESDYPVKPFYEEGKGRKSFVARKPSRQVDFDSFFGNATADQDWYGPEEKETARRYRELVDTLKANLTDIRVYKVGKASGAEFDIYVVGKTGDGDFAGVTTKVVET